MSATTSRTGQSATPRPSGRVRTVLRVSQGERYVGDILLDRRDRVWRRADTVPPDVVLKALLAFSRDGDVCGQVVGRLDGREYSWFVLGAVLEMIPAEEMAAAA